MELAERLRMYVVTDDRDDIDSLISRVRQAILGGATTVQLRRKRDDGRRFVELGHRIRQVTSELGALYIVNDRVDVAMLTNADGVHVGQTDIACQDVRRLVGDMIVGVSVANLDQAMAAVAAGADYLGVGSMYSTSSKSDAVVCGLSTLYEIAASVSIPIVAIGGITADNAAEVMRSGADGIAVVSAVMSASDPLQAAKDLLRICQQATS
ncbi:thiamine phosphate synthase [Alicyclobacillus acidiphilus]|uniref:thiamine phosphate synthase n=1 Tax=Alicyclobacillus acidiphilus TaxID=182455 RepID=UPI000A659969|nr:thiamine phosphate synthase [Alicyclobacillus acidiphilus]